MFGVSYFIKTPRSGIIVIPMHQQWPYVVVCHTM